MQYCRKITKIFPLCLFHDILIKSINKKLNFGGMDMIAKIATGKLQTLFGEFTEVLYYNGQKECVALCMGNIQDGENVLCRVHSSCLSAHVFNSTECDCREQFAAAQNKIQEANKGIIIWLDQEGKANGHYALLQSIAKKKEGLYQTDAYEAIGFQKDARDYTVAAEILSDLGVKSIIMLTNNPEKVSTLENHGVKVNGICPLEVVPDSNNELLKQTLLGKASVGHNINPKNWK